VLAVDHQELKGARRAIGIGSLAPRTLLDLPVRHLRSGRNIRCARHDEGHKRDGRQRSQETGNHFLLGAHGVQSCTFASNTVRPSAAVGG
jgi:hypothetical protein